jgi:hypothetical protein
MDLLAVFLENIGNEEIDIEESPVEKLNTIVAYIESNLNRDISIEEMSEIYDLENLLLKSNCKISIYMEDKLIIENDFDNGTIHSYSPNYDEFTVKIKKSDDDKGYLLQFLQPGKDFDKYNGKVFTVLEDIGDIIFPDGFIVVFLIDYNLLEYDEKEQLYVARNIEMTFKDYSSLMLQEYKLKVKNGIIQSINFVGYDTNYSLQFSDYNNVDLEN